MKRTGIAIMLLLVLLFTADIHAHAEDIYVAETELYHNHTGNSTSGGGCYYTPVYHVHTGNGTSGGGCYSIPQYHYHSDGCYSAPSCNSATYVDYYTCNMGDYDCGNAIDAAAHSQSAGAGHSMGRRIGWVCRGSFVSGNPHTHSEDKVLSCGKNNGQILGYGLGCGKNTSTIIRYDLACDASDHEFIGIWGIKTSSVDWVREVVLSASVKEGEHINSVSYSWNTGAAGDSLTLTENGNYVCTMQYKSHTSPFETSSLSYEVTNIDREAPTAEIHFNDEEWEKEKVISIANAEDLKCGLNDTPYRFFDGSNWTEWSQTTGYTVRENGTYKIEVRDRLENTNSYDIEITHIDGKCPDAEVIYDDSEWEGKKSVSIQNASDDQSGLHEMPYRFFDGSNWTEWGTQTEWTVYLNAAYVVEVRDAVGNVYQEEVIFNHIDQSGPVISTSISPSDWTTGNVKISVDVSSLCGLAEEPFSYDEGETWTATNITVAKQNGTYKVWVKDLIGRVNEKEVTVSNIDRVAPSISKASYSDVNSSTVKISVSAYDSQSGLAQYAYSYDGGSTWVNLKEFNVPAWEGGFSIKVRDAVGNYVTYVLTRNTTKDETDQKSKDNPPKVEEPEEPDKNIDQEEKTKPEPKEKKEELEESEEETVEKSEEISEEFAPKTKEKPEIKEIEDGETPLTDEIKVKRFNMPLFAGIGGGTILIGIFAFIWFFRTCKVLGKDRNGDYKCLGRKTIWRRKSGYSITFSQGLMIRAETSEFKIVISKRFAERNSEKSLHVNHGESLYITPEENRMAEEILIHVEKKEGWS